MPKRLTDEERKLYDQLHSRADLTDDTDDDPEPEDDEDIEALLIRGPGLRKMLAGFTGSSASNTGGAADDEEADPEPEGKKRDPKPPSTSKYFGGRRK